MSTIVKQEINLIIKNLYFKFLANNIILSIVEGFFSEKIKSNIKMNAIFFYTLSIKRSI